MRSPTRVAFILIVSLGAIFGAAAPSAAQAFGIGARLAMVRTDADPVAGTESDSVRFTGGQIRVGMSQRASLEVSLDRHTETFEALNEEVKETPLQASLLLYLAKGGFAPYVLAGPGWYSRRVESLSPAGPEDEAVTTRKFGWHGGFGAEIRMGRHAGLHADYRYTYLRFGDDDEEEGAAAATGNDSLVSGLLPSHDGSMWTVGVTIYF
jgi:opacity protein-like surface antigen